ncbi:MAG TPA: hypothetical protein VFV66_13095 [Nonomuraea sp.]|nr:hypothetical protein [Nonomuraea sp.]
MSRELEAALSSGSPSDPERVAKVCRRPGRAVPLSRSTATAAIAIIVLAPLPIGRVEGRRRCPPGRTSPRHTRSAATAIAS